MDNDVTKAINKALDGGLLDATEIGHLLAAEDLSEEAFAVQRAGRLFASQLIDNKAEVHGQIGLNTGLCPIDCKFCSFAKSANVFPEPTKLSKEEAIEGVLSMERKGANAIYVMVTAHYPFDEFCDMAKAIHDAMETDVPMVANVGDFSASQAQDLLDAGFTGVYHAIRMGEGEMTGVPIERRMKSIEHAREAGLLVGMCVEPVGPEHTVEELVEKTLYTRDLEAVFSGSMRRTAIPQSSLYEYGQVSYLRMATIVAAVSLATGTVVPGNCTHEPNQLGAYAGANLVWAEVGSNPRDTEEDTAASRGWTVDKCRDLFEECGWDVLDGPSVMFSKK